MPETVALLLCIGAATMGGVFFAFSTFVIKALARLPAGEGVAAMQRTNVVVLNRLFVGRAVLAAICVVAGFLPWGAPSRPSSRLLALPWPLHTEPLPAAPAVTDKPMHPSGPGQRRAGEKTRGSQRAA
jgi:hypothetical protein